MIKLNDPNSFAKPDTLRSSEKASSQELPVKNLPYPAESSHGSQGSDFASLKDLLHGVHAGVFPVPMLREKLRKKISQGLIQSFDTPELVEGLAEFLLEVVQEDPQQGELLGLSPRPI